MNKRLQLDFLDELNKSIRVSLDDPKDDLLPIEIEQVMDMIVSFNAIGNDDLALVGINGARIITTTVDEIEF